MNVPTPRRRRRSAQEKREIVELASRLLTSGLRKSAVKKELIRRFDTKPWTTEKYIARAKKAIVQSTSLVRLDRLIETAKHWLDTIRDPKAGDHDRYLALQRLHKLFGLEPPSPWELFEALI